MAFVWRRGGLGSVRLPISNKQKVTSLRNWTIWPPDLLCGNERCVNYVGCLTGACWVAFEGTRRWFVTFRADSGANLAFRSLKWRCWADSCVIMLLPTRVGEKKSQVNASGEAARRHPAPEATPDPWNRWKTDCWWAVNGEACPRGRRKSGDFTSLGSALLARYSLGCIYYLHLDGRSNIGVGVAQRCKPQNRTEIWPNVFRTGSATILIFYGF